MTMGIGATKWEGGSYDPETHIVYVYSQTTITSLGLVPPPNRQRSDMNYIAGSAVGGGRSDNGDGGSGGTSPNAPTAREMGVGTNIQGLPLVKPPWGRITAINLDKGEIVWQVAHGDTPDGVKNHPALKGISIPRTGRLARAGTLVTKTLVIAGEGGVAATPAGRGAMLRAYDKATGMEVGAVYMPAQESGSPMTYMFNGKQYIVIAISGGAYTGEFLAFALPNVD
jgi:quinoprotein glucose dehydrogenase